MRLLSALLLFLSLSCSGQPELLTLYRNNITAQGDYFLRMHGQSNSVGQSPISELSVPLQREFTNVYIWVTTADNSGHYELLQAGVNNNQVGFLDRYGAEIGIADRFEQDHPDDVLYISKYSVGGTTVFNTACPNNWNISCSNSLLDKAIDWFDLDAMAAIPDGTIEFDLGMIWMQGETDATNSTWTSAFQANTLDTFAAFRTREGYATMPIIACQVNFASVSGPDGSFVRIDQSKKPGNINDPATYAYNFFFRTDNYASRPGDPLHWEQLQYGYDLYLHYFPTSTVSPWVEEVQQLLQKAKDLNYNLPNGTAQAALNTLIQSLKADGTYDKLDAFWIFGWNDLSLQNFSRLNVIAPGAYQITTSGTITFNGNQWKGVTSGLGYLNTNFQPDTHGVNYTLNDASRGMWISTAHSSNEFYDGAVTTNINTIRGVSTVGQRINQGGGNLNTAVSMAGTGYKAIDRQDATNVSLWNNTTESARTGTSTVVPNVNQFIMRSATNYGDAGIRMYYIGSSLTDSQHTNFVTYFTTFQTAVGL